MYNTYVQFLSSVERLAGQKKRAIILERREYCVLSLVVPFTPSFVEASKGRLQCKTLATGCLEATKRLTTHAYSSYTWPASACVDIGISNVLVYC